jgi:uncharacterized beta-barrel protein YwiB (DUF1934 family)|nr:DUF1934 domain-containing protein [uncultured Lachnoclostridium sp.]
MTKEVIVSIAGLQYETEQEEAIEVISLGEYYFRNGKHFVLYDELLDQESAPDKTVRCTLKIAKNQVELTKKGDSASHMVFELGKSHMNYYTTPFGDLMIGVTTKSIDVVEREKEIMVELLYALDINYQYVSECNLTIKITERER